MFSFIVTAVLHFRKNVGIQMEQQFTKQTLGEALRGQFIGSKINIFSIKI